MKRLTTGLTLISCGLLVTFGCSPDPAAPPVETLPQTISLVIVSGDGQSGPAGAELLNPLVVKATDSKGKLLTGIAVNFRVTSGGGSVFAGAAVTDMKGNAEEFWTLGTNTSAPQVLEVRAVAAGGVKQVFGVFTANALPHSPTRITAISGDGQSAPKGTAVAVAPAVRVADQFDNPVPNHAVTFALSAGGGALTGAAATTNAAGIATLGSWTLGSTICPNALAATAAGTGISGNPATFTATGTDCWTLLSGMPTTRQNLSAGALNGRLYAVGGFNTSPSASVERYDPTTATWSARVSMPTPRYGLTAAVADGFLFAIGGSSVNNGPPNTTVEAYDPVANVWTAKAAMPTPRRFGAAGVVGGKVYVVGGIDGNGVATNALEVYDPSTNTWSVRAPMPTPRSQLAVAEVSGVLYAVGGFPSGGGTFNTALSVVEAYDPVTDTWTVRAPMPSPRASLVLTSANSLLVAIGGETGGSAVVGTVEAYQPATNSWSTRSSMSAGARGFAAGALLNGLIYVVGGNDGSGIVTRLESYVP